jgi:phosphoribosylglycinamide formyltransferase-1
MKRIAVLGSGNGSNAENIYRYFQGSKKISVVCFYTNNKAAYIVKRAEKIGIPCFFLTKELLSDADRAKALFKRLNVDYLVLAGFLIKIPRGIISLYPNKILNIHPSLLPKYGGKGMYGDNVHKAVLKNKEANSGITVHYVNNDYDKGEVVFQKSVSLKKHETKKSLKEKVHALELEFFPKIIEMIILKKCQ